MTPQDISLHQVRAFRAVAINGSFTAAARQMNLAQSSLSRSVRDLEHILGASLFERNTRNVELTAEGIEFRKLADQLVRDLTVGLDRFRCYAEARAGTLSISTIASFAAAMLPRLLGELFREGDDIEIHLADGRHEQVLNYLVSGSVELAVTADPGETPNLSVMPILQETFSAIVPHNHPWVGRDHVYWGDFDHQIYVAARHGTSIRAITDQALAEAGATVQHRFHVSNIATLGGLVRSGFGVSALPAMEFEGYRLEDLVRIPVVGEGPKRTLAIVSSSEHALSPTARRFLGLVPELLHELPLPSGIKPLRIVSPDSNVGVC